MRYYTLVHCYTTVLLYCTTGLYYCTVLNCTSILLWRNKSKQEWWVCPFSILFISGGNFSEYIWNISQMISCSLLATTTHCKAHCTYKQFTIHGSLKVYSVYLTEGFTILQTLKCLGIYFTLETLLHTLSCIGESILIAREWLLSWPYFPLLVPIREESPIT